ncbi:MAG: hypothetical protein KAH93_03790 [Candidatus Aenigmarchaeota archaeon]|nr:hypothetical protein [Candidatus Aenigmarchaeota archaeon]
MIKKTFVLVIGLLMLSSLVFAQGQGIPEPRLISENPEITGAGQQTKNEGEIPQIQTKEQIRTQINEIKQETQQKKQQMDNEAEEAGDKKQQMLKNQNQVRLAVHSLLAMEDLVGGIGPQVREIARSFNNSVQSTIKSEEKIQTRSSITRFFAGGDAKAAQELETEVTQNQQRIQELKQLKDECDCDEEVKAMMQEQIQQMEQEQTRLQELAESEKKSKGLLGWLWK